jgi:hypothetical protein
MLRKLHAILVSLSILFVAGVAFSDAPFDAQVMDFDETTNVLFARPIPGNAFGTFNHTATTIHFAGPPIHFFPPNPCRGVATAWNDHVAQSNGGKNETHAFGILLGHLAQFQCNVTMSTVNGTNDIQAIAPAP